MIMTTDEFNPFAEVDNVVDVLDGWLSYRWLHLDLFELAGLRNEVLRYRQVEIISEIQEDIKELIETAVRNNIRSIAAKRKKEKAAALLIECRAEASKHEKFFLDLTHRKI
jgi:hypothetical protein